MDHSKPIFRNTLPSKSLLNSEKSRFDYIDSYQLTIDDPDYKIEPIHLCKAFFSSAPQWVDYLFRIRNKIVSMFGLKTGSNNGDRKAILENFKCQAGERLGLFKVFEKNENEVVMGEDDKHLNFRVSLLLENILNQKGKRFITISTIVIFNNRFGRLYFAPVKPFHKLIVPLMLKGIIKELQK